MALDTKSLRPALLIAIILLPILISGNPGINEISTVSLDSSQMTQAPVSITFTENLDHTATRSTVDRQAALLGSETNVQNQRAVCTSGPLLSMKGVKGAEMGADLLSSGCGSTGLGASIGAQMPNCGATCDLTYHGGRVMQGVTNYLIFWLPSGYNFDNKTIDPGAANPSNARYEEIIKSYFQYIGGSSFYPLLQQYNSSVGTASLGGVYVDTTPYPSGQGSIGNPLNYTNIDAEITSDITSQGWSSGINSEFFVFTGYNVESCSAFGYCTTQNICGWHNYFTMGGSPVIYANLPDDGGRSGGNRFCLLTNFGAPTSGPNHDPFADAEVNTLSHEQFESVSDPLFTAWYYQNASGEIGDLCNGYFGPGSGYIEPDGSDIVMNGNFFLVQTEWNNALSGCALDPALQPVQATVQLFTCSACPMLALRDGFPFGFSEAGERSMNQGFANATDSAVTIFAFPNSNLIFSDQSHNSNSTVAWCLTATSAGVCVGGSASIGLGNSLSYSYYELVNLDVSATLIGGGSPMLPPFNYTSAPQLLSSTYSPSLLSAYIPFTAPGSLSRTLWALRGSSWNVTNLLPESGASERWISNTTSGSVTSPTTLNLIYIHQFHVSFAVSPTVSTGSFSRSPSAGDGFYTASSTINLVAQAAAGYEFSGWSANSTSITFGNSASSATTATVNGAGTITASFQTPTSPLPLLAAILVIAISAGGAYVIFRRRESQPAPQPAPSP